MQIRNRRRTLQFAGAALPGMAALPEQHQPEERTPHA